MSVVLNQIEHETSSPAYPIGHLSPASVIQPSMTVSAQPMKSDVIYKILAKLDDYGMYIPDVKGIGRFANVYKAEQSSAGEVLRTVAIKILRNTARNSDQELFRQEIERLRELSLTSQAKTVKLLDIIHMEPMIMCGCGRIYHPQCPECGRHPLQRRDASPEEFPALACPDPSCGYVVSANNIEMQYKRLTSPPAKQCCVAGSSMREGTIINFVDRPAIVLELEECKLDEIKQRRSGHFAKQFQQSIAPANHVNQTLLSKRRMAKEHVRLERAMALDKLRHMVQVVESVAWLHGELKIIHKDLTPDNIMVNYGADNFTTAQVGYGSVMYARELVQDLISHPNVLLKVIDFGLADRDSLTRKWYEERDINTSGMEKQPYFSPEAIQRFQRVNLTFDSTQKRFVVPRELLKSPLGVHEGDVLAFQWDHNHEYELTITRIERGPESDTCYAYFEGKVPPTQQQRETQLILPLGEAHDIYSIGALFYFILTEEHLNVQGLSSFVRVLQDRPCELTASELKRRHGETYLGHRDYLMIPDPYWRDRAMELILRAMVRGRTHSFNESRTERGARPALDLLRETKRIYREFEEELLSEKRVRKYKLAIPAAVLVSVLGMFGITKLHHESTIPPKEIAPQAKSILAEHPELSLPPSSPNTTASEPTTGTAKDAPNVQPGAKTPKMPPLPKGKKS